MSIKKVGILCDPHKQSMFEEKLKEKGFTDYKIFQHGHIKLIKVTVEEVDVPEVHKVCEIVQLHFQRGN